MNSDAGPYLSFLQPATDALIRAARLAPGHLVLDIGTGFGDPALDAARAVAPNGHVTGVDHSADSLERARERARTHSLGNVAFQEMEALELRFPDDSFDAVLSRLVVVYFPDPTPFLAEIMRVLKPGGRAAIATWTMGDDRNPLMNIGMRVLRRYLPPDPAPAEPTPSPERPSNGAPGVLEEAMRRMGYQDTATGLVPLKLDVDESGAGDYWEERRAGSPASLRMLARIPQNQHQTANQEVVEAVRDLISDGRAVGELVWAAGSKGV